jgi:hypothetical protein
MTYPPTTPGFPAPQQPGGYGAPPSYQQPAATPAGPSKLPVYLTAAVAAFGLAAYLASFGPLLTLTADIGPFGGAEVSASPLGYWTVAALLAALLAAVSLLPKAKAYAPVVAVTAVLGVLLVISQVIKLPQGISAGWALWLVLLFTLLQAAAAIGALLYDAGVLSAPAPRPRFEQPYGQYGPPPGGYYGGPGAPGQPQPGAQQPGYPTQYGAYPAGASGAGATPGYGGQAGQADNTNTPPTGFPSYTPPSASGYSPPSPAAEPTQGTTPGAESSSPGSTPS